MPTLPETFKVDLRIRLEEKYTMPTPNKIVYTCEIIVHANGAEEKHVFGNGVDAINYAENILRDFTNTMIQIRRDTLKRRQKSRKNKGLMNG